MNTRKWLALAATALALLGTQPAQAQHQQQPYAPQLYVPSPALEAARKQQEEAARKQKEAARAEAKSPAFQQYCTRLSGYAGAIVDYRDSGMTFDEAVERVFQSEWEHLSTIGGDMRIASMPGVKICGLANILVAKAYMPPYQTIADVAAAIRTDCINEGARAAK